MKRTQQTPALSIAERAGQEGDEINYFYPGTHTDMVTPILVAASQVRRCLAVGGGLSWNRGIRRMWGIGSHSRGTCTRWRRRRNRVGWRFWSEGCRRRFGCIGGYGCIGHRAGGGHASQWVQVPLWNDLFTTGYHRVAPTKPHHGTAGIFVVFNFNCMLAAGHQERRRPDTVGADALVRPGG